MGGVVSKKASVGMQSGAAVEANAGCIELVSGRNEVSKLSGKIPFRAAPDADPISFIACVNNKSSDEVVGGVYKISTSGEMEMVGNFNGSNGKGGGILAGDGKYYTVSLTELFGGLIVNCNSWQPGKESWKKLTSYPYSLNFSYYSTGVAHDPVTGNNYGSYWNTSGNAYEFGTAVYTQGATSRATISALDYPLYGLACGRDGILYAFDHDGNLNTVNKETGALTLVGATGFTPGGTCCATVDDKTGKLYWCMKPADGNAVICEVNKESGAATLLGTFTVGCEITGLYFPDYMAHPSAPGELSDFKAEFNEGSLSGSVSFCLPTTYYNGTALEGSLDYRIYADGEIKGSGSGNAGSQVSVPVTLTEGGVHTFQAVAVNAQGEGPTSTAHVFLGIDTPVVPTGVTAVYEPGTGFTITWNPVTETVNGGYIDPSKVSYSVYRMPGNVEVASGLTATTAVDPITEPDDFTVYWYKMEVVYDGNTVGSTETPHYTLGTLKPGYTNTFDDASSLDGYTIIDGNNDNRKWYILSGVAAVSFNDNTAKDDWLITPPVKLEGGKVYKISADVRANVYFYPETFEIKFGKAPDAEAMTTEIVPVTKIPDVENPTSDTPIEGNFGGYVYVAETGNYYVGVHAVTPAGPSMFRCDNLSIGLPIDGMGPKAVSDLNIVKNSFRSASISFTAPVENNNGETLAELDSINVYRDGDLVKKYEEAVPGQQFNYEDNVQQGGTYEYEIAAYNRFGEGTRAKQSIYIGVPTPYIPGVPHITEPTAGTVTLTWDPSTKDFDQLEDIPAEYMRYYVVEVRGEEQIIVADKIAETSFTYSPLANPSEQEFKQWAVFAVTEGGISPGTLSKVMPVGQAYTVPFFESFSNLKPHTLFGTMVQGGFPRFELYPDDGIEDVESADRDNGFFAVRGTATDGGDIAMFYTGKIDLGAVANPTLNFQIYNIGNKNGLADDVNDLVVFVKSGDSDWQELLRSNVVTLANSKNGWQPVFVDLSDYAHQQVQLGFQVCCRLYTFNLFDAIRITDYKERDAAAMSVVVPGFTRAGDEMDIYAIIGNLGDQDITGYNVSLLRNGVEINKRELTSLHAGQIRQLRFRETLDGSCDYENLYQVKVSTENDGDVTNDLSQPSKVMMRTLLDPGVRDLTAAAGSAGGVDLSWNEPDLSTAAPDETDDSFETYESWTNSHAGDWKFHDLDKGKIGSLNYLTFPGIPTGSQQSFWVMDDTWEDFETVVGNNQWRYMAADGHKYIAQAFVSEQMQCDDWAVSPLLYGGEQSVSFYAKSFTGPVESFEFLISDSGDSPEDFELMERVDGVPQNWTQYCYTLPEGTKYFAVRCVSQDKFMLFFDNFNFVAEGNPRQPELKGYNVYRDGSLLTAAPVKALRYTDTDAHINGPMKYHVTAVYGDSESKGAEASISLSGVDGAFTDEGIAVTAGKGCITVRGCNGNRIVVASADGQVLYSGTPSGILELSATPGIYVVKGAKTIIKVIVR